MAKVVNRYTLIDWMYKRLGQGAVKPPITIAQVEDSIDESLDYFTEHAGGVGTEIQYAVVQVQDRSDEEMRTEMACQGMEPCFLPDISAAPFLRFKQEYQLPRCVKAIGRIMEQACDRRNLTEPILERGFALTSQGILATGIGGIQGAGFGSAGTALWTSNFGGSYSSFGGRGGQGTRAAGGGADIIGYELGLEYLEMLRQRYTVKLDAEFHEASRKIRFIPPPVGNGVIVIPVWARVQDSDLYDNIWIRRYALAIAKINIAYNVKKYTGVNFPGGSNIDGDFYLSEGKEERDKLEQEIADNKYSYPVKPFWFG
jgi:hypothetical protein